jgi:hypothetical protein
MYIITLKRKRRVKIMDKIYVIRCQELYSDGHCSSCLLHPAFKTYESCLKFLKTQVKEEKLYYIDSGWEESDINDRIIWHDDPNETWVKFDFNDEYTIYNIEEMEVQ